MANSSYEYKEIRFKIERELTICYVYLDAYGDSPTGVEGWHAMRFPASVKCIDILKDEIHKAVLWPQEAP